MTLEEAMQKFPPMWTIYDHPRDFPDYIVVRRFFGEVPCPAVHLSLTLTAARLHVMEQGGCFNQHREFADDPCIVETWI